MSKQIEEMANVINEMSEPNAYYYDEIFQKHEAFANSFTIAEHLYNADYRKASDVAKEIFAEIDRMCIDTFGNFNHRVFAEIKKKYTER